MEVDFKSSVPVQTDERGIERPMPIGVNLAESKPVSPFEQITQEVMDDQTNYFVQTGKALLRGVEKMPMVIGYSAELLGYGLKAEVESKTRGLLPYPAASLIRVPKPPVNKYQAKVNDWLIKFGGDLGDAGKEMNTFYSEAANKGMEAPNPAVLLGWSHPFRKVSEMAVESLPMMALAAGISVVGAPEIGVPMAGTLGASTFAPLIGGDYYEDAIANGVDPIRAMDGALINMAVSTALEGWVLTNWMKGGSLFNCVTRTIVQEGLIEEGSQQGFDNTLRVLNWDSPEPLWERLTNGLAESVLAGALTGGVLGAFQAPTIADVKANLHQYVIKEGTKRNIPMEDLTQVLDAVDKVIDTATAKEAPPVSKVVPFANTREEASQLQRSLGEEEYSKQLEARSKANIDSIENRQRYKDPISGNIYEATVGISERTGFKNIYLWVVNSSGELTETIAAEWNSRTNKIDNTFAFLEKIVPVATQIQQTLEEDWNANEGREYDEIQTAIDNLKEGDPEIQRLKDVQAKLAEKFTERNIDKVNEQLTKQEPTTEETMGGELPTIEDAVREHGGVRSYGKKKEGGKVRLSEEFKLIPVRVRTKEGSTLDVMARMIAKDPKYAHLKITSDMDIVQAFRDLKLKGTQKQKVAQTIETEAKSIREIAEETQILEPNIRRILGIGEKEGTFTRVEKGVYILNQEGRDVAYVQTGDSVEILPQLAQKGLKADMVFLDIPYKTKAVVGGNRGIKYNYITPEQFEIVVKALSEIVKSDNSAVFYMYSQAQSGKADMKKYNDIILKYFKPVAKGEYVKYQKDGITRVRNMRGHIIEPEGIILLTKSGNMENAVSDNDIRFNLVRPKGYQTEKPAEMLAKMVKMTTKEGELVLDPFAGSGVALTEAVKARRKALGIEISPEAVAGIQKKFEAEGPMYSIEAPKEGGTPEEILNVQPTMPEGKLKAKENQAENLLKDFIEKKKQGKQQTMFFSAEEGQERATVSGKEFGKGGKEIPPGTATGTIAWEQTEPWKVNLGRDIAGVFEREIGPKLQVSTRMKRWLGVYYSMLGSNGLIRVRSVADEVTMNHETGHFLDDALGKFDIEDYRAELLTVSKFLHPFEEKYKTFTDAKGKVHKRLDSYSRYRHSRAELFAEFIALYTMNQAKAAELAPEFSAIADEEMAKNAEFTYIVTKLREFQEQMRPMKEMVASLRKVPEILPLLQDWVEKGNLFQELWRDTVGRKVWDKFTKEADKLGQKDVAKTFFERRGIGNVAFERLRQVEKIIKGQKARVKEVVIDPIAAKSAEEQKIIAEIMQRFEVEAGVNPELAQLSDAARKELAVWGNEARKLGLLNDLVFWNNVGQYFPFFYSAKEFNKNKSLFGHIQAVKAKMGAFKHKMTDIEFGVKYLKTLGVSAKEMEMLDNSEIADIGQTARVEFGLIQTAAYPLQKRLFGLIETVNTIKGFNSIAAIPGMVGTRGQEGFIQMPKSKKYGALAGKYAPENFVREVAKTQAVQSTLSKLWNGANTWWKMFKVPYSPAAVTRNLITNLMMAYFADVPIWNPAVSIKGAQSFIKKDEIYQALRDYGLYHNTYTETELKALAFELEKNPDDPLGAIKGWANKISAGLQSPAYLYGATEDASKTIMASYAMSQGADIAQAVKFADKWLFDYSSTSEAVGVARKGMLPFITWSMKVLPRLAETAIVKPEKFLLMAGVILTINALSRAMLGIDGDDEEKLKPDYIRGKPTLLMPQRDTNGDLNWVDLSFFLPFGNWLPIDNGKLGVPQTLTMSSPLMSLYNALVLNYDPFLGQIAKDDMTEDEKIAAKVKYLRDSWAPSILTQTPGKIIAAGKKDKYGRKSEIGKILSGEFLGIRYTADTSAYRSKIKQRFEMDYNIGKKRIRTLISTGKIDKEEGAKRLKKLREEYLKKKKTH